MFGGGFKSAKCKTLLRLAMSRIKLLRNKRDVVIKQMRRDIAQLLSSGQDTNARIRVEHIAREQNIMAAYDLIELFCELIIVRLPIIDSHKVCPMDLKEAICSLIFASPRCADLPELLQIRTVFSSKYGKEFVAAALELRPDCGVNRRVVEKLSVRTPSGETKVKILTEIAEEYHITWDPAATLAELLKQPEDLLDGPAKFCSSRDDPLPEPRAKPSKTAPQPPTASDPQRNNSNNSNNAYRQGGPSPLQSNQPAGLRQKLVPGLASLSLSDSDDDENKGHTRVRFQDGADAPSPRKSQAPARSKTTAPPPSRPPPTRTPSSAGLHSNDVSTRHPGSQQNRGASNVRETNYDNVAAAAQAAADSADRAVAAARAAARLATTESQANDEEEQKSNNRNSAGISGPKFDEEPEIPPRGGRRSGRTYHSSSSSDEDIDRRLSAACGHRTNTTASREQHNGGNRAPPLQPTKSSSCYIASASCYRKNNGDGYRP